MQLTPAETEALHIASMQYGALSRRQALGCGMTARQVDGRTESGLWVPRWNGIYLVAASDRSQLQEVRAACLRGGDRAVASHRTSAALWGLCDIPRVIEIAVPRPARGPVGDDSLIVHRPRRLSPIDVTMRKRIPVTAPERTLIDLAAVLEPIELAVCLDRALSLGRTRLTRLCWRLGELGRHGRVGCRDLVSLVSEREGGRALHSALETQTFELLRDHGYQLPERQVVVHDGDFEAHIDLAWSELFAGIECHGFGPHSGRIAFRRDRRRLSHLHRLGWRIVLVTWDDLVDPTEFFADLAGIGVRPAA